MKNYIISILYDKYLEIPFFVLKQFTISREEWENQGGE